MKFRVCAYNESLGCLRVAHIDFYIDRYGTYVLAPFTKGEVGFSEMLVHELDKVEKLENTLRALREAGDMMAEYLIECGQDNHKSVSAWHRAQGV